ncbi:MAG: DNA mismatch repair protein MutS [Crocinitomicaceae bacterium]
MDPRSYFETIISANQMRLNQLKRRALLLSMLRLIVFLIAVALMYFFWGNSWVIALTFVVGFGLFLFLVSKYTDVRQARDFHAGLKKINKEEIKVLEGDVSHLSGGSEYLEAEHHYNQDIDLFGEGSIFQMINRTGTKAGRDRLAKMLNSNEILQVKEKQEAIAELSKKIDWRQHYQVTASMVEEEVTAQKIVRWLQEYKPKLSKVFRILPGLFSLASLAIIILYGWGIITGVVLGIWFFLGLGITGLYLKKITSLYNQTTQLKATLSQYAKLIWAVEEEVFESEHLQLAQKNLQTEGMKASTILSKLVREIGNLDQRNNIFFGLIANGFLLWDLRYSYRIEKWMKTYDASVEKWFETITFFDSMNSFGNYAFIRPAYVFPLISNSDNEVLSATQLGHPNLYPEKRVDNHVSITNGDFFIITGANMAGKSTFLRTIALNLVMANCGLPVCAQSFTYKPIKLISSMRTSDSLKDDESYFFSELKRLKFIVEEIQKDRYFIILDEILKGTNSKDKAEGSKKFVQRLVASKSTGLIATHDLSLCSLENDLEEVKNYFFEAEIINDELSFDYKLKEGICKNMNASFLLKKMDIV